MAALIFVDALPKVKPHHGHFLVAANSEGETINLLLTRHALLGLGRAMTQALETALEEDLTFQPVVFVPKRRKEKA